jgi:hypothetical protein
LVLLNFSKVIKFIESCLSDRDHLFYNIPKDAFGAWNSGQRPLVSPSSVELQQLHKLSQVQRFSFSKRQVVSLMMLSTLKLRVSKISQELVMEVKVYLWLVLPHIGKVGVWHHFEQEAQDTVAELRQ